jgi:hypothetical protein
MVKNGRGREEDRGEPSTVAPEQNRALGRYVTKWTRNPEEDWETGPKNRRYVEETNVMFGLFHTCSIHHTATATPPLHSQQRAPKPYIFPSDSDSQHSIMYLCEYPESST